MVAVVTSPTLASFGTSAEAREGVAARRATRRVLVISLFVGLLALMALSGALRLFSTFADYDDEGYLILSVREVLAGEPLYQRVYSQYGPAFFGAEWLTHGVVGVPLRSDVTRIETLAWWLVAAVAAAFLVFRLGGGLALTTTTLLLAFLHLERLAAEPGHPQALAVVILLGALHLATSHRASWWLGAAVGVLTLIKVNLGAALGASVALALLGRPSRRGVGLVAALTLGVTLVPLLSLALAERQELRLLTLAVLVGVAVVTVVLVLRDVPDPRTEAQRGRQVLSFLVAAAATATAGVAGVLVTGTPLSDLLDGLIVQHSRMLSFDHPPALPLALALGTLACGPLFAVFRRRQRWLLVARWIFGVGTLGVVFSAHLTTLGAPLTSGLQDLGGAATLLTLAPLVWLVVVPPAGPPGPARTLLALVVPLQLLSVYPVAGTQTAVATLPLLIAAMVVLGDAFSTVARESQLPRGQVPQGAWALVVLAALTLGAHALSLGTRYLELAPLGLPGTAAMRLVPSHAGALAALSGQIEVHCSTFVSYPQARNSLYLWSRLDPPTGFNATLWPLMLGPTQQEAIVTALRASPAPCLVWQRGARRFEGPLVEELEHHYPTLVAEIGPFRLFSRDRRESSGTGAAEPLATVTRTPKPNQE